MSTIITIIQRSSRSSGYNNQRRKRNKGIQIGKEVNLSLLADDMTLYVENPKDSIRKLLELISELSKVERAIYYIYCSLYIYKSNTHKSVAFLSQFSSVAQSCPTLCNLMNCNTPGLPIHHQLTEFTETHVRLVSDAIQPSHPLSSPSPPAPNPSQHQSLFQ